MDRRTVLKTGLAAAGTLAMPAYLRAQSNKKISILTWNIADQEALFKEEFDDFRKANPGVEIEWLDKKGPDLPAFYQTQLVAGTAPDIIDIQGAVWVEWAANGALLDLTPYFQNDPAFVKLFNPDYMSGFVYEKKNYLVPCTSPRHCCSTTKRCSRKPGSPRLPNPSTSSSRSRRPWAKARRPAS
jgi:ABC-type glycerol-3-phosphate transport system substrate-binding protein